ncbi:MAG: hypothetical protein AB7G88_13310 [Thermomicrobiales bacterium]
MTVPDPAKTYLWCDTCRRSFSHVDAVGQRCPICGEPVRPMGKMSAILRGLMATEMVASDLRSKHRQLIRMIWTRDSRGEKYFRVLEPDMTYSKFEARVTDIICNGLGEGWITLMLPLAPSVDEGDYAITILDEERFIDELHALVEANRKKPR